MKRFIFLCSIFTITSLFLFPKLAAAGSCQCTQTNTDFNPNTSNLSCNFTININSHDDCIAKNGTTSNLAGSHFTYSNCRYCSSNDCTVGCENDCTAAGLQSPSDSVPCDSDNACSLKTNGIGTAKCCEKACYFDNTGLTAYNNFNVSILGISQQVKLNNPSLEISIPGLNFSPQSQATDTEGYIHITFLAEYLAAIYKFALAAASIVGAIVIILNGFRIVVSAGGEQKNVGIKHITQAVIGLILLWSSYFIFYTINPDLVQFKALKIKFFDPKVMSEDEISIGTEDTQTSAAPTASTPAGLMTIPKSTNITYSETQQALPDVITALKKAVDESQIKTIITTSFRPASYQYSLMQKYCGCPVEGTLPANVSKSDWNTICSKCNGCQASCSLTRNNGVLQAPNLSHFAGNAIDIASVAEGSYVSCSSPNDNVNASAGVVLTPKSSSNGNTCVPQEQQVLIKAMLNNGFCVGLSANSTKLREPWHFEYTKTGLPVSGFCTSNTGDANLLKLFYLQH